MLDGILLKEAVLRELVEGVTIAQIIGMALFSFARPPAWHIN